LLIAGKAVVSINAISPTRLTQALYTETMAIKCASC
jgi:hypothetical protein